MPYPRAVRLVGQFGAASSPPILAFNPADRPTDHLETVITDPGFTGRIDVIPFYVPRSVDAKGVASSSAVPPTALAGRDLRGGLRTPFGVRPPHPSASGRVSIFSPRPKQP